MTRRGSCYCDFQCAMKDVGGEILLGALFIEKELVKRWMLDWGRLPHNCKIKRTSTRQEEVLLKSPHGDDKKACLRKLVRWSYWILTFQLVQIVFALYMYIYIYMYIHTYIAKYKEMRGGTVFYLFWECSSFHPEAIINNASGDIS